MTRYDVVVIGGGTAGISAALAARSRGVSVALVEREPRLGGDCTFFGCVPSKALIDIARVVHDASHAARAGLLDRPPTPRIVRGRSTRTGRRATAHREPIRHRDRNGAFGPGARRHRRGRLPHERDDLRPPRASAAPARPRRRRNGSRARTGLPAPRQRRDGRRAVATAPPGLVRGGIRGRRGGVGGRRRRRAHRRRATRASRSSSGILLEHAHGSVEGDALLVATGRRADVDGLGLEEAGIPLRDGFVPIDERCRTAVEHVFAAGDVNGGRLYTHVAAHEGTVAGLNAAGRRARLDEHAVPEVVFTDPELARVGTSVGDVSVVSFPMERVDRARIRHRPQGFVTLVTAPRRLLRRIGGGRLVGATIVGDRAGELIHECALTIQTGAFAGRLAQTIHAYPTMSLAVQQAAAQLFPLGRLLVESGEEEKRTRPVTHRT